MSQFEASHSLSGNALRNSAAAVLCALTFGSAELAQPQSASARIPKAAIALGINHGPYNLSFGLAGVPTESEIPLTQLPTFPTFSSPNSDFSNSSDRIVDHEQDLAASEAQIDASLSYNEQYQGYNQDVQVIAPTTVSTEISINDETAETGQDSCDRDLPDKEGNPTVMPNPNFNLGICKAVALGIEKRNLYTLMAKYPQIIKWTAFNEPENAGNVTNSSLAGPAFAVRMWAVADEIAIKLGHGQVVAPDETWNFPSAYDTTYDKDLIKTIKKDHLPMPRLMATHLFYKAATCNNLDLYRKYLANLNKYGLLKGLEAKNGGDGIEATEAGTVLSAHYSCDNSKNMANAAHKNTSKITAADEAKMAQAQYDGGKAEIEAGYVDPAVPLKEDMFAIASTSSYCWGGGAWDTSWFAPNGKYGNLTYTLSDGNGIPGTPRIAYYIMTGRPVPKWMTHPKTKQQVQLDEEALIPPINWTGSKTGDCKYAQTIVGSSTPQPSVSVKPVLDAGHATRTYAIHK